MLIIALMANKTETVKITIEIDREVYLALSNKSDITGVSQKNLSDMAYRKFLGLKPKFKKGE